MMGIMAWWKRRAASRRKTEWRVLLERIALESEYLKLSVVNQWWNRNIDYRPDSTANNWKHAQWTLEDGFGDCEDFAIGKMETLIKLGIPAEKLRLIHVETDFGAHMVLGYYPHGLGVDPLILDNTHEPIFYLSQLVGYEPLYSVNSEGLEQGGNLIGHTSSKWNDLAGRIG